MAKTASPAASGAKPTEESTKPTPVPGTATGSEGAPATGTEAPATEAKTTKSIVPAKYAGRYKAGGSDALAEFIKAQCTTKEGFQFPAFFDLCRKNGIPEEKVAHYEAQVAEKRHGAQGRARMTLRNMLATVARKDSKLKGLDGNEHEVIMPKVVVTGAAKAAQESAAGTQAPVAA